MTAHKEVIVYMDTGVRVLMDPSTDAQSPEAQSAYRKAFAQMLVERSEDIEYMIDSEELIEEEEEEL